MGEWDRPRLARALLGARCAGSCALGLVALGVAALGVAAPGASAAPAELLPDLLPLPLETGGGAVETTIEVEVYGGRPYLDAGFKAANIGRGPLELLPLDEPVPAADCDGDGNASNDRPVQQNVYVDGDGSGDFDAAVDTSFDARDDGCGDFHPGHGHWHTVGITTELTAEGSGARGPGIDKYAFCLVDADTFDPSLPGWSEIGVYPFGGCGEADPQGISVGWYDVYSVGLPGQQVDISGVPAGNYCLRQTVDGGNLVDEIDDANNSSEIRMSLDPEAATVAVLAGACLPPDQPGQPPAIDQTAPDTSLISEPGAIVRTKRRRARLSFAFASTEPGSSFACRLDGGGFSPCATPFEVRRRAKRGAGAAHTLQVRATDASGNADSSPAEWHGVVKRRVRARAARASRARRHGAPWRAPAPAG